MKNLPLSSPFFLEQNQKAFTKQTRFPKIMQKSLPIQCQCSQQNLLYIAASKALNSIWSIPFCYLHHADILQFQILNI